jgi:hypothetical protein
MLTSPPNPDEIGKKNRKSPDWSGLLDAPDPPQGERGKRERGLLNDLVKNAERGEG